MDMFIAYAHCVLGLILADLIESLRPPKYPRHYAIYVIGPLTAIVVTRLSIMAHSEAVIVPSLVACSIVCVFYCRLTYLSDRRFEGSKENRGSASAEYERAPRHKTFAQRLLSRGD